ncbi:MAG: RpiB/LacA/LacB family sugar-phosphate isomerase [Alphaproteobacteria bacterium]|nr:RpiB/LacA/LacB family sugar-phosphate isomerase [Alphaproteobacteria bacterium]
MKNLTLNIASDHRGFVLKTLLVTRLREQGHMVHDFGPADDASCDAGDFAQRVAADLRAHPDRKGILICGSGQAMTMTANRFSHIRAALCLNTTMARLARAHNDANILVLGAHITGQEVALDCLDAFLTTDFLGGRYADRCAKLTAMGGL